MREVMLVFHFIGLAMGLGTSFGFMFLGMASAKMEPAEAMKFRLQSFALSRMGHVGLTLLVLSGLYLITPYWSKLSAMPFLIVKLVLVLTLGALIGMISSLGRKAQLGNAEENMKKLGPLGRVSLLTTLVIVILAVYIFK